MCARIFPTVRGELGERGDTGMMTKRGVCIALWCVVFSGPVYCQTFDPDTGFGSTGAQSGQALQSLEHGSLTPQQKELVTYFENMMELRQKLYNSAVSGVSEQQTAVLLDTYLGDLKGMRVPPSVRQYHDALIKIMETGSQYRTSGAADDEAGQEAMRQEFNAILDEAGMLGAVQQQMQTMGVPSGNLEAVKEDGTDSQ